MSGMNQTDLHTLLRERGFRMADLADALKVERSTVWRWCAGRLPAERVVEVERITGIPREQLRPDLYTRLEIVG